MSTPILFRVIYYLVLYLYRIRPQHIICIHCMTRTHKKKKRIKNEIVFGPPYS